MKVKAALCLQLDFAVSYSRGARPGLTTVWLGMYGMSIARLAAACACGLPAPMRAKKYYRRNAHRRRRVILAARHANACLFVEMARKCSIDDMCGNAPTAPYLIAGNNRRRAPLSLARRNMPIARIKSPRIKAAGSNIPSCNGVRGNSLCAQIVGLSATISMSRHIERLMRGIFHVEAAANASLYYVMTFARHIEERHASR